MAADNLLSVVIEDDDADRRSAKVHFLPAATLADVQTYLTAYAPLLDAVSDGKLVEAFVQMQLTLPAGLKANPIAFSEVQKGANLTFLNTSRYKYGVWVPAWKPSFFSDDGLTNDAQVTDFIAAYYQGLAGVLPSNGFGFDLTSFSAGKKTFRK